MLAYLICRALRLRRAVSVLFVLILSKSFGRVEEYGHHPLLHPKPSCQGSSASPPPVPAETVDGNVKTNDDLMMALQASRDQVPALNFHGVCVLLVLQYMYMKF